MNVCEQIHIHDMQLFHKSYDTKYMHNCILLKIIICENSDIYKILLCV